jgi:two-component system, sensor histidine kinase and response regulator
MTKPGGARDIEQTMPSLTVPKVSPEVHADAAGWNKAEALARIEGDEELLLELCQIFRENSPKLLLKLQQAVAAGNCDGVLHAAHSLKGESSYLSASATSNAALQLEEMGRNHDLARASETLAVLEREVANLLLNLKVPGSGHE